MELKVLDTKNEPLLARKLIKAAIEFPKATPSYPEVNKLLANHLKTDEKLIAIRHIYNLFGSKKAEVTAYVYTDENKKQLIEPKTKEKKDKKAKEAKKQ